MNKKILIVSLFVFISISTFSQQTRVLFIGNSYTDVNNLPLLFQNVSASTGDQVEVYSNTPGGCTFQQHCSNQSATLIQQGGWDYVVLQEQSQLPSFPISQVQTQCFPYAAQLNQMIETSNPCAETVFYMTWGRKYGDQQNAQYFPIVGTYEGMDSLLHERYMQMTQDNNAIVSPVGRVWRYIRENYANIELYSSDNSHPSLEGSYAAACAFYTTILRKDPTLITNYCGLDPNVAQIIQNAAKFVIFNNQSTWYIGERELESNFTYSDENGFDNISTNTNLTTQFVWDFGNGDTSHLAEPNYSYSQNGQYTVTLNARDNCGQTSIKTMEILVNVNTVSDFSIQKINLFPNPNEGVFTVSFLDNNDQKKEIEVYDMIGKMVHNFKTDQCEFLIDISQYTQGIYFVKIKIEEQIKLIKVVVQ